MRVLLDEMLDRRLKELLPEETVSVRERGWGSKKNGELLELAEKEFDAFLTTDRGIPHQQNLSKFDLAIILLRARSNRYEVLSPLMGEVNSALESVVPGALLTVPTEEPSQVPCGAPAHACGRLTA